MKTIFAKFGPAHELRLYRRNIQYSLDIFSEKDKRESLSTLEREYRIVCEPSISIFFYFR
jgi:hypothetical protein